MAGGLSNTMKTTPAVTCLKIILTVLNVFYFITGLSILSIGIWVKVQLHMYLEMSSEHYNNHTAPLVLILVGLGIMVVTLMGCCCTVKGTSYLLYVYALLLFLVFITDLAVSISFFIFKSKVEEGFSTGMTDYMKVYATDSSKKDSVDDLQSTLHCCGNKNYTEWYSIAWTGSGLSNTVPASCYGKGSKNATLYDEGCYDKVVGFLESNMLMIGGVAIAFSFVQLFGALIACCLGRNINRSKYEQVA